MGTRGLEILIRKWGVGLKRSLVLERLVAMVFVTALLMGCLGGTGGTRYAVSGRIVERDGIGIAGVELIFSDGQAGSAMTDSKGNWKATLQKTVHITPIKNGYVFDPPTRQVDGKSENVDFTGIPVEEDTTVYDAIEFLDQLTGSFIDAAPTFSDVPQALARLATDLGSIPAVTNICLSDRSIGYTYKGIVMSLLCWEVREADTETVVFALDSPPETGSQSILGGREAAFLVSDQLFLHSLAAGKSLPLHLHANLPKVGYRVGFVGDILKKVDLARIRDSAPADFVFFQGHGLVSSPGWVINQNYETLSCSDQLRLQELGLATVVEYKGKDKAVEIPTCLIVLPAYIQNMNVSFSNSIIVTFSCSTLRNDDFPNAFFTKGAKAYIGWTSEINHPQIKPLVTLMDKMIAGFNLEEAMRLTKRQYPAEAASLDFRVAPGVEPKDIYLGDATPARLQLTVNAGNVDFHMRLASGSAFPTGQRDKSIAVVEDNFWVAETEATYKLWYEVRKWALGHGYVFANAGREGSDGSDGQQPSHIKDYPVTMINWRDAVVWCNALSEMLGYTPSYHYQGSVIKDSTQEVVCDNAMVVPGNGFRLPADNEWELAARYQGGDSSYGAIECPVGSGRYWTPGNYASGAVATTSNAQATRDAAWYLGNSNGKAQPVGSKPMNGNGLGVFDMSGNVYEWCFEWHPSYVGSRRIARAGSFGSNGPSFMSINNQGSEYPSYARNYIGLRLVKNAY